MLRFFWKSNKRSCEWRTFCDFLLIGAEKLVGDVFLEGESGAKAKRRGKNNHFYNAKSEAEATGNSNSLQSASGKMSDSK